MKVVVVIPTYNERENITLLLDQLADALDKVKKHAISYLVVDDTSPDGTAQAVAAYQKSHKNVHIILGKKEGLGKALLRGMTHAVKTMGADIILQMDADLSHDPKIAPKFLAALDNGATFVVGSRYIPGGAIPENWGLTRKIYSVLGNNIVRFVLGHLSVHDWTGGYRAYTKKFYEEIHSEMTPYGGYVFQIAFLHKSIHHGARVKEIPFHFTDRLYGHSKIAPAEYIFNIYKYIITARWQELLRGSFGKFLGVGFLGFIINAALLLILHDWFGWQAAAASLVGAALAIFSNFNLNNLWTFRQHKISGVGQYLGKLVQFYGTSAFGVVVIQTGTIWLGVHLFGDKYYFLFFLMGTGLLLLWNYTMYSKVIWSAKD
ncbi:MAG: Dolichyl-phosphate beta-D-mannosyltransferase [Candidatus Gottesmanbacteria bacterium GW2011_GWB1_49_7]|uniref:Dolichyl-phosphate beta-D-mannosyltransferase n=1 Tax=Candidatus Gottesmanbacteria bacterium GW2011_GWB1_49_7 TaxID=1618448 RepID=A0A0G1VYY6_9BACT|nr:MAG: Dolichyl-phosphate beta-D-mannosyltransferase [Candidatus Gottesmanbacteria bacterium GW2011_GWB1_49_7]